MNSTKESALEAIVEDLNNKISRVAKTSYLAGDSPEVFYQKVGAAVEELGAYVKKNFE